ncbi:MAG: dual specificity protein phosphatase family protein [Patescibacteria group bacterium]|nr:dual specificity protein phosphatase family protein [Patescibacteria group bacterium]
MRNDDANAIPKHEAGQPKFEYTQIDDQIYIGTNACCAAHFDMELIDKDITADISLEGEKLDQPFGVESFVWLPTKDHTPPTRDAAETGIAALEEMLARGKKVYIHCKNGQGRAPTFYAAYLIRKRGMTPDEAVAHIKSKKPGVHLEDSQMEFLESLIG